MGNRRGFTLIEVLVALAIVALALGVLVPMLGQGFRGLERSDSHSLALLAAESRLAEVGASLPLAAGRREGTADGLRWRLDISLFDKEAPRDASFILYAVEVAVYGAGESPLVRLATLKLAAAERRP